jgi:hypothetical protein
MIPQSEVFKIARQDGVGERVIEKDYVLSWALIAVAESELKDHVAFKGGTALKKVYFPEYRFSEDLDFTLPGNLPHDDLLVSLQELLPSLLGRVNLRVELSSADLSTFGSTTVQASYIGPLQASMGSRTLKMDFTRGEMLVNSPTSEVLRAPYSDYPKSVRLPAYTLNEILAEKLCALMGRTEPRDLYDVYWVLEATTVDPEFLSHDFMAKAEHKGHDPARLDKVLQGKASRFESQWDKRLAQQVQDLPQFDPVMRAVRRHVRQLELG